MKINFKVPLVQFGESQKEANGEPVFLNKGFANVLGLDSHSNTGLNYMDALKWASDINEGKEIDLDKEEQRKFKAFIENNPNISSFGKMCLLQAMEPPEEVNTKNNDK